MSGSNTDKTIHVPGYHLRTQLARGGMGAVYRAYQISMDRVVAVKVLAGKFTEDTVFVERFQKEARAAARLNHPNIVQAIDVAESDGHWYFVMEFVEGSALSALLRERGKLPPLEACGLIVQIARALEHASRFGMLHLDVKPGNIMVTPAGCAKRKAGSSGGSTWKRAAPRSSKPSRLIGKRSSSTRRQPARWSTWAPSITASANSPMPRLTTAKPSKPTLLTRWRNSTSAISTMSWDGSTKPSTTTGWRWA